LNRNKETILQCKNTQDVCSVKKGFMKYVSGLHGALTNLGISWMPRRLCVSLSLTFCVDVTPGNWLRAAVALGHTVHTPLYLNYYSVAHFPQSALTWASLATFLSYYAWADHFKRTQTRLPPLWDLTPCFSQLKFFCSCTSPPARDTYAHVYLWLSLHCLFSDFSVSVNCTVRCASDARYWLYTAPYVLSLFLFTCIQSRKLLWEGTQLWW
jgi:hypothetical protein